MGDISDETKARIKEKLQETPTLFLIEEVLKRFKSSMFIGYREDWSGATLPGIESHRLREQAGYCIAGRGQDKDNLMGLELLRMRIMVGQMNFSDEKGMESGGDFNDDNASI